MNYLEFAPRKKMVWLAMIDQFLNYTKYNSININQAKFYAWPRDPRFSYFSKERTKSELEDAALAKAEALTIAKVKAETETEALAEAEPSPKSSSSLIGSRLGISLSVESPKNEVKQEPVPAKSIEKLTTESPENVNNNDTTEHMDNEQSPQAFRFGN